MRVLILCAGSAERWGGYLGVPKHFAPINGEAILDRTLRLVREVQPDAEVVLIVRSDDPNLGMYDAVARPHGATLAPAVLRPERRDADKFLSSEYQWSKDARTIMLYGDCYFTTAAMRTILDPAPLRDGWAVYARFGGSKITGTPWAENLAHAIEPAMHDRWRDCLESLPARTQGWFNGRCGGHEQYMAMETGNPCQYPRRGPHGVHIDDWSDDFDYPADWDRWCLRYAEAPPNLRARAV